MLLLVLVLFYWYDNRTSLTLSPPDNAPRVTVAFNMPDGITLSPLGGLYESDKCTDTHFNSNFKPYQVSGVSGVMLPFIREGQSNIWKASIATEGGGRCQWKLSSIRVGFRLSDDVSLVDGKKVFDTSYLFDFKDNGIVNTYGTGPAQDISGDLNLKTDFFPMITYHKDNTSSLRLFGGNADNYKWSRHFRLHDTRRILIEPVIHFSRPVTLTPPDKPGDFTATYPDGSSEEITRIYPDYEKLLSMK